MSETGMKVNNFFYSAILCGLHMASYTQAPIISSIVWGKVVVKNPDGKECVYKDCILTPKGSQKWDWNKTGTEHVPGIQIDDIKDFIDEVDIIILSKGMDNQLQTKTDTYSYVKEKKKKLHILNTRLAVEKYNELVAQGVKVGALIHSTC